MKELAVDFLKGLSCGLVALGVILLASSAMAAPKFVTPSMTKRNGLTDEQYERLWAIGRNPRIEQAAAREWVFRASRYTNVVEWLSECGRTNDFAKLSHRLQSDNFNLSDLNRELSSSNSVLTTALKSAVKKAESYENDARVTQQMRKAAKRAEKNLSKVLKTLEQAKKKAASEDEEALWTMLINILSGVEPNE